MGKSREEPSYLFPLKTLLTLLSQTKTRLTYLRLLSTLAQGKSRTYLNKILRPLSRRETTLVLQRKLSSGITG